MGVYLRDNMGCMTDFGYVILDTNLLMFMTIQACTAPLNSYSFLSRFLLYAMSHTFSTVSQF